MDDTMINNRVELRGTVSSPPQPSHENRGEKFLTFPLEICRLSGAVDMINIIAREQVLRELELNGCGKLRISGELRSFNNKSGEGSKLVISVFARSLELDDGEDMNEVTLMGTLCKPPNVRVTPMGREICDLMLAVNRRYGRSDYIPCIAWGQRARTAAEWRVGDSLRLEGRIQSRRYIKNVDDELVEKTAFEVSVIDLELV